MGPTGVPPPDDVADKGAEAGKFGEEVDIAVEEEGACRASIVANLWYFVAPMLLALSFGKFHWKIPRKKKIFFT